MTVRLYCGSGQSNCVEGALTTALDRGTTQLGEVFSEATQVMRLGDSAFVPPSWESFGPESLQPRHAIGAPLGPKDIIGHSISMGRGLRAYYGPSQVVMARYAVSGTTIGDWLPGATPIPGELTPLYDQMIAFLTAQLAALTATLEGFWWTQGNGDANTALLANAYATKLGILFTAIRTDMGVPNLRIVYDQLPSLCTKPFTTTVRAQQVAYAATDSNARMVPTDDTYTLRDGDHYTAPSFMRLGWHFANAFIGAWPTPALLGEF